jgi:hypothetical protein
MKYHRLFPLIDERILGKYPQIVDGKVPTTVNHEKYLSNYLFKKSDKDVQIPKGILHKKAKLTDVVTASFMGFSTGICFSEKLMQAIRLNTSFGIEFLKTEIYKSETLDIKYDYYIPHVYDFLFEILNYKKTIILHSHDSFVQEGDQVYINNAHEHKEKIADLPLGHSLELCRMVFLDDSHCDFFSLRSVKSGDVGFFVSDKLLNSINEQNCIGMVFTPINATYP